MIDTSSTSALAVCDEPGCCFYWFSLRWDSEDRGNSARGYRARAVSKLREHTRLAHTSTKTSTIAT